MNDIEYIEALQNLITQRNELRSALAEKEKECANLKKILQKAMTVREGYLWMGEAKQALEGGEK
jgi:flagellar biosynthesis chaperone FliJ